MPQTTLDRQSYACRSIDDQPFLLNLQFLLQLYCWNSFKKIVVFKPLVVGH